jgi:hypothetical protein
VTAGPAPAPANVAPVAPVANAAQTQAVSVTIVDAARIVVGQMRQTMLEAIVAGRTPDGVVTLKTAQGSVQVRPANPLPVGTALVLELTRTGEQISARVIPAPTPRPGMQAGAAPPTTSQANSSSTTSPTIARNAETAPVQPRAEIGRATFPAVALASPAQAGVPAPPVVATRDPPTSTPATPGPLPSAPLTQAAASGAVRSGSPLPQAPPPSIPPSTATSPPPGPGPSVPTTPPAPLLTQAAPTMRPSPTPTPIAAASERKADPSPPRPEAPRVSDPAPASARPTTAGAAPSSPALPTSKVATPLPTPPEPMIAARAASIYAQARGAMQPRDPRAPPQTGSPARSAAAPTDRSPAPPQPAPMIGIPKPTTHAPMPTAPAASQQPPGQSAPRLQPGTTLELRLAQPAARAPQTPDAGARAHPLTATVVGAMPQGRLMVDTPIGRLAVTVPPDLLATPPGGTLDLEWLPETSRPPAAAGARAADARSTRAWPQIRETVATLLAQSDPATRAAADQLVPKPGPRLAQQMMAFIGRGDGDLSRWLGEAMTRALEQRGLGDLLARGDGAATREPERQSAAQEWRHVTLPLFDGSTLHPVEFRTRRRNEGGRPEDPREQSRFVVDCIHDELGAVQIDGLLTKGGTKKRLDVVLRSHVELPEADRLAIAELYLDACGAMGFGGEIAFQVAGQFPAIAEAPATPRAVIA